jgi:uncharacterized protein (DUF1778 family)
MAYKDKAQKTAAQNKYISKAYDRINLLVPKGGKEQIQAAADAAGQSVNAYILEAVQQRMTADGSSTDNGDKL